MTAEMPTVAVLAGGLGTRIRELAGDVPKVLLPVEGRPFIRHLLEYLFREGARRAVLCLGHSGERIWEVARSHAPQGLRLVASWEQKPLGTAGALRNAISELGETFFVVNGDTYLDTSLSALWERHRGSGALLTLSLVRSAEPAEKGSVHLDARGRVLRFAEKTMEGTGLINGGVYVVAARALASCPEGAPCSLEREVIPRVLGEGRVVMAHVVDAPFVDIGLPEDYLRIRERLPRRRDGS